MLSYFCLHIARLFTSIINLTSYFNSNTLPLGGGISGSVMVPTQKEVVARRQLSPGKLLFFRNKGHVMVPYTAFKWKVAIIVAAILLYLYCLLLLKHMYVKSKRLDKIEEMGHKTAQLIAHVQRLDEDVERRLRLLQHKFNG